MSVQEQIKRFTAPDIRARKNGEPIVSLTAYHAHTARLVDKYCDVILVGDSLGMVMHGLETTVPVTLEMMILQGHAVMRGSSHALVVVDMPFGSYEASKEQAFMNAARVMKFTSAKEIKAKASTIKSYVREAIAVEKSGQRIEPKKTSDYPVPPELAERLKKDPRFKRAFEALTPGRQRSYLYHFAAAKQSATRVSRIEKAMPAIFEGRGFLERR